ncbi:MAG: hypothetical protein HY775_09375 [Acidobacteria bacterium]|nr:hypothetical protein [Acidobacteriota bacterium]
MANTNARPGARAGDRLGEALASLLAHDLRVPLGPLTLAASLISGDPATRSDLRDLARVIEAQARRLGRLIDASVAASRGARAPEAVPTDLGELAEEAAGILRDLGGQCVVRRVRAPVLADPTAVRDALAGLIEAVAGEGGGASVVIRADATSVSAYVAGGDAPACLRALAGSRPTDARSALALGAAAVFRAHAGGVEVDEDGAVARLPRADS